MSDVALSPSGRWILRVFFTLVVLFLYAPIVILLIFSFNKSPVPTFPLSGFTFHWYREFVSNGEPAARSRRARSSPRSRASAPSSSASSPRSRSPAGASAARRPSRRSCSSRS